MKKETPLETQGAQNLKTSDEKIRCNRPEDIINWIVISWIYGEDQLG
jgi:hypothetical protein